MKSSKEIELENIRELLKINVSKEIEMEKIHAMMEIEVMKIAAAEDIARINILQENPEGYREVKPICDRSTEAVRIATTKQIRNSTTINMF
jgi:hypothetical protein